MSAPLLDNRVIRQTRPDPGFVFVEVDAHHLPLAHADEVVDEAELPVPDEHHADFGLGGDVGGLDGRGVVDLALEDEVLGIADGAQAVGGRADFDSQAGEGEEGLQDVVVQIRR